MLANFPEKFAIRFTTLRQYCLFSEWMKRKTNYRVTGSLSHIYHFPLFNTATSLASFCASNTLEKGYRLVSFEAFENEFLKTKRNIIGYKAPFDLYGGPPHGIQKGELYTKTDISYHFYRPKNREYQAIPEEIVEKWEPVYEKLSETVRLEDGSTVQVTSEGAKFDGFFLNRVDIAHLLKVTSQLSFNEKCEQANLPKSS